MPSATVDRAIQETIQADVRDTRAADAKTSGGFFGVTWMAHAGQFTHPWWSPSRDISLRALWKRSDHLAGAIYTMLAKMTTIPFKVVARDQSNKEHVEQAAQITIDLEGGAQFGEGWGTFYSKWIEDLLTQDNGAFGEIIGPGRPDGPLTGKPITIATLDSARCTRTGVPEFPVVYEDTDGTRYKLHYTRVMSMSQMPSPAAEMNGVGFCAVSRCINVAQTLVDILTFKQEKLGSRPHRAILIPQGGLSPDDVRSAFELAESEMTEQGLRRYSKIVLAGDPSLPEADLLVKELTSLPDGFEEETSIVLGMATIALALGVDARELFPAMTSGATRADALLMHLKQRGKGPGQILQITEQHFNNKFLPHHLELIFDFQDDAQDRQIADIKNIRASKRKQDLDSGALSMRVVREQMVEYGDLSREQFERIELQDGRLEDGTHILTLFFLEDKQINSWLDMGVEDPLDTEANDKEMMLTLIKEKLLELSKVVANARSVTIKSKSLQALMALAHLEKLYLNPKALSEVLLKNTDNGAESKPEATDTRTRTVDLTTPNLDEEVALKPDEEDQAMTADRDNQPA